MADGDDEDAWVDPGQLQDAFDETQLEDPMQALAEARGLAGKASQEATEHAAPAQRVQPPMQPPADAVPEFEPPAPEAPPMPPAPTSPPAETDEEPKPPTA